MATVSSCPSCAATVRAGDPWCTLCWTDLRPKPEPVPVAAAVASGTRAASVDPLTAPLATVLDGPRADPAAPQPTWPCVMCQARNHLDLNACGTCGAPFGGHIARTADPKGAKRRLLLVSFAAVGVFLLLLAVITLLGTKVPKQPDNGVPGTTQQSPGQSSNNGPAVGDGTIIG
ncbi:MAG: hypothetical protein QOE45_772 [Frankiaceae bacterium]|jgi:hypothetical protein|nr:hypothetical protein [Frankiaceae bacterium]